MDNIAQTLNAIETTRRRMEAASVLYGLSSDEVLRISQELDELLNDYERFQDKQSRFSFK